MIESIVLDLISRTMLWAAHDSAGPPRTNFLAGYKDLAANEVRVGLRYAFGGGLPRLWGLPVMWSGGNLHEEAQPTPRAATLR